MDQKIYIVELKSRVSSYYLASLSGTYSKVICDAVIFTNEVEALKYASISENQINECISETANLFVGKVEEKCLMTLSV